MTCDGNCKDCKCENKPKVNFSDEIYTDSSVIWDESGFPVGSAPIMSFSVTDIVSTDNIETFEIASNSPMISYKYAEDKILADLKKHLDKTYTEHYATDNNIECFDAWIALGDSTPTFRNTALKYLWRYGKKNGNNKQDLMKALHYIFMCLYVDHYKDEK